MISRNSMDDQAWASKGESLIDMSEYEKAVNSLQTAVQIDSRFAEAWFYLAKAYAHANNEDDALDSLVVSTSLDSEILDWLEDSSFDNIKNHATNISIAFDRASYRQYYIGNFSRKKLSPIFEE